MITLYRGGERACELLAKRAFQLAWTAARLASEHADEADGWAACRALVNDMPGDVGGVTAWANALWDIDHEDILERMPC